MYEERRVPVKEGEEYDVEIESVGEKGDGIAKVRGFVLFVSNTRKGDYVKVRITKVLQNVGFAEVVKKLEKIDKPVRRRKFMEVKPEELEEAAEEPGQEYEDTEDFGEDLEEE